MGERHTDTTPDKVRVTSTPTLIVEPANRARVYHVEIPLLAPPVWIGFDRLTPFSGRLVTRMIGLRVKVGPDQSLYAVTVGVFSSTLHLTQEDQVDEGRYTDDGSGDAVARSGRGSAAEGAPAPRPMVDERVARRD